MSAFADAEDAKAYAREWLEEQAINDIYAEDVETNLNSIHEGMHEAAKEIKKGVELLTADWVMGLYAEVLWRDACRLIQPNELKAIIRECLPSRPVQPELEPVYEKYPDGSTEQHVIMEEVEEYIDRYKQYPIEVMLETLSWHKAAQAVFVRRFKEQEYSD